MKPEVFFTNFPATLVQTKPMLSDCDFILVLVIGPDPEEDKGKEQGKKTPHIGQHLVNFIVQSLHCINGSGLLYFNLHIVSRVEADRVNAFLCDVVALLSGIVGVWPNAIICGNRVSAHLYFPS